MLSSVLLLFAVLSPGCASPTWAGKRPIDEGEIHGTLFLPHVYEPLMPGSVYPNRRVPIAVQSRPAVIVVPPSDGGDAERQLVAELGLGGLVAFVLRKEGAGGAADIGHVNGAVRLLARVAETREAPVGVLLFRPDPGFAASVLEVNHVSAVVVLGLIPAGAPAAGSADVMPSAAAKAPVLVGNLSEGLAPSPEVTESLRSMLGRKPVEKWYRPGRDRPGAFPPEAFRDAAEWLAQELELR